MGERLVDNKVDKIINKYGITIKIRRKMFNKEQYVYNQYHKGNKTSISESHKNEKHISK